MIRALFLDPLTIKDLSGVARRWQTYVARVVYVALVAILLVAALQDLAAQRIYSASEIASIARTLFQQFAVLQMLFVTVSSIAGAADSMGREARAGMLGLLALTPLTGWRIAAGKWKACMARTASLVLAGTPILAVCVYLGGAGPLDVAWCILLSLAQASLGAAVALFHAAEGAPPYRIASYSLLTLLLHTLLTLVLGCFYWDNGPAGAYFLNPFSALGGALDGRFPGAFGWLGAAPATFLLSSLFLMSAAGHLKSRAALLPTGELRPAYAPRTADLTPEEAAKDCYTQPLWDEHPILWKEWAMRWQTGLAPHIRSTISIVLAILVIGLSIGTIGAVGILAVEAAPFVIAAVLLGASLFSREAERRQWNVLFTTPVTVREFLASKLLGGLFTPGYRALPVLFLILLVGSWWTGFLGVLYLSGGVSLFILLGYTLAAWASLRFGTTRDSALFAFAALGLILLAGALLPGKLAIISPGTIFELLYANRIRNGYGYRTDIASYFPAFVVSCALYAGTIAALVASMARRFRTVVQNG